MEEESKGSTSSEEAEYDSDQASLIKASRATDGCS